MNKTALLLAFALVATAGIAAAPTATADTIVECAVFWTLEGHQPAHCLADCSEDVLDCKHDEDDH